MAARMLVRLCARSVWRGAAGSRALSGGEPASRLYGHVKEGYTGWPQLDMERLSRELEEAERELRERRPGIVPEGELRALLSSWEHLQRMKQDIHRLEEEKIQIANKIKNLALTHDRQSLQSLPSFQSMRNRGKEIRQQLTAFYQQETTLEDSFYLRALKLPNRTHPGTPVGDESNARELEVVGVKPEFDFKVRGHLEIGEDLDIIRQR